MVKNFYKKHLFNFVFVLAFCGLTFQQNSFCAVKANVVIGADGKQQFSVVEKIKKFVLAPQNRVRLIVGGVTATGVLAVTIFGLRWLLKSSGAKNEPSTDASQPGETTPPPLPDPIVQSGDKPQALQNQQQNVPPQTSGSSQPQTPSQSIDQNDEKLTSPTGTTQASVPDESAASEELVPEVLRKALAPVYDALPMNKEPLDSLDAKLAQLQKPECKEPPAEITDPALQKRYREKWSDTACELYQEKIAQLAPREGQSLTEVAKNLEELCVLSKLPDLSWTRGKPMVEAWKEAVADNINTLTRIDPEEFKGRTIDGDGMEHLSNDLERRFQDLATLQLPSKGTLLDGFMKEKSSYIGYAFSKLSCADELIGGSWLLKEGYPADDAISILAKLYVLQHMPRPDSYLSFDEAHGLDILGNCVAGLLIGLRRHGVKGENVQYTLNCLKEFSLPLWLQGGKKDFSQAEALVFENFDVFFAKDPAKKVRSEFHNQYKRIFAQAKPKEA